MTNTKLYRIISGTFLIAGTMIGAGMLGIPLVTAESGFIPGLLVTLLVWFFMYCTGLIFLEVTLWMPDGSNVLSISNHFLGRYGRWLSGGMFVFLYYCLMIAYFAAGGPLLAQGFGLPGLDGPWSFVVFGVIFGTIVAISPKSIDRTNIIMSVAMIASWLVLIGSGGSAVQTERLIPQNWSKIVFAMPVLFSAFGFHNIIPSLCTYLKRDRRSLRQAIFWGSLLPLIVYIIWQWLIIGAVPLEVTLQALKEGIPITDQFQSLTGSRYFVGVGRFFAFFAVVTSTLGVAFSMVDFLGDGFRIVHRSGLKRIMLCLLTFIPPLIFAMLNPHIFTVALGVAGGFGEAFLNGLLPVLILFVGKFFLGFKSHLRSLSNPLALITLAAYSIFVVALELYQLITH